MPTTSEFSSLFWFTERSHLLAQMGKTYRPQPNELWKYRWLTGPDDRHSGETLTISGVPCTGG